jgi:cytidylate kinase
MTHADGIIIAIDGPAGSGKSSTARAVAAELGYRHLDSGAFYRGITFAALRAGIDPDRWGTLRESDLHELRVAGVPDQFGFRMMVEEQDVSEQIRSPDVNAHVSRMAAVPAVRDWLLDALRAAGARGGLVADGRDIGTVVFPDAELKIFLIADPEARARRRLAEQGSGTAGPDEVRAETARLAERDRQDTDRPVAPLLRAPDATLIDTTSLRFEDQVARIVRLARERARDLDDAKGPG